MELQLQHYRKSYNQHLVLAFDNAIFKEGIHWIKGENGSGKSTLLRSVAGLVPFEGQCKLGALSLENERIEFLRKVNYAYAEPQYPPYLSGHSVLMFVAETKNSTPQQINDLVALFGVSTYYKAPISTYSSGMLKKITLIAAFLGNPSWILLDEPFTTIDFQTTQKVYELINQYHANGCNFLIASHQWLDENQLMVSSSYEVKNGTLKQLF